MFGYSKKRVYGLQFCYDDGVLPMFIGWGIVHSTLARVRRVRFTRHSQYRHVCFLVFVVFMKTGNIFCSDGSVLRKMRVSLVLFLQVHYRADHGKCLTSAATCLGAALGTSEGVTLAYVLYAALDRLAVHEEHH